MPNVSDSATTESDREVQSDVARPQLSNTDGRSHQPDGLLIQPRLEKGRCSGGL